MKRNQILIVVFVVIILYFLLKQYTTQVSASVNKVPTGTGTTTSSNPVSDFLNTLFKKTAAPPTVFKGVAAQPTLQQLGTLQQQGFDFSYCGVSKRVIDPASGVLVNWCIDARTGNSYSLDQFPNGQVPFRILSDPNQIRLSEDMNGLTSNAYNSDTTAANSPMKNLGIDPLTGELIPL